MIHQLDTWLVSCYVGDMTNDTFIDEDDDPAPMLANADWRTPTADTPV